MRRKQQHIKPRDVPDLDLGHLYRFQGLSGKTFDKISTSNLDDLGLFLFIVLGEPDDIEVDERGKPVDMEAVLGKFAVKHMQAIVEKLMGGLKDLAPLAAAARGRK